MADQYTVTFLTTSYLTVCDAILSSSLTPDPLDIDDGLYNFLSPQLITHMEGGAGPGQDPRGAEAPRLQGAGIPDKPEWFQKGTAGLSVIYVSIYHTFSFSSGLYRGLN